MTNSEYKEFLFKTLESLQKMFPELFAEGDAILESLGKSPHASEPGNYSFSNWMLLMYQYYNGNLKMFKREWVIRFIRLKEFQGATNWKKMGFKNVRERGDFEKWGIISAPFWYDGYKCHKVVPTYVKINQVRRINKSFLKNKITNK